MQRNKYRSNYNQKYKDHYNIDFNDNYVIHHIDENRKNNDIENLVLLPRGLHSQYHLLKRVVENHALNTVICGNQANEQNYYLSYYERFINVYKECNKWYDFKKYLNGEIPNIHGITLQGVNNNGNV